MYYFLKVLIICTSNVHNYMQSKSKVHAGILVKYASHNKKKQTYKQKQLASMQIRSCPMVILFFLGTKA